jgi:hypothetical protein
VGFIARLHPNQLPDSSARKLPNSTNNYLDGAFPLVIRAFGAHSKKSCGLPVVVLQETAQSLLAAYFTITATHPLFSRWKKQNILFTLMVSLSMVVLGVRRYRSPQ